MVMLPYIYSIHGSYGYYQLSLTITDQLRVAPSCDEITGP